MAKQKTGYVRRDRRNKRWVARVTYVGNDGKRKSLQKSALTKPAARELLKGMILKLESKGEESIKIEKILFRDVAERYSALKIKPPKFRGDKVIEGMRSHVMVKIYLRQLLSHFGGMKLPGITPGSIQSFKELRLSQKTNRGSEYSIAAVNRELQLLRAILNFAKQEGMIERTPFERSTKPLIEKDDEVKRTRVLSKEEELRLLEVCNDPVRAHIKPIIICGIDTGMRKNEILSLEWSDVDLESREIHIRALQTKTLKSRTVPISDRLYSELSKLRLQFPKRNSVFGCKAFHHSWKTACEKAEISDLHYHDCRHTFCSRLVDAGMDLSEIAKISGHADINILFKIYINPTSKTIDKARTLLDKINGE